jgi:hypothetical protein
MTKQQTMSASDFNLEKLSTKELSEHIGATIKVGGNMAIFGRRGSGKTEISKQEIKKSDALEVYINLSVMERVDLGGYPNIMGGSAQKKFVDFLLPQFYEAMLDGERPVVALLDEVDKADPSLWAPLLEFTQFHSINGRKLNNLHAVIMTGNLIAEGGSRPSLPLLDRAEKYLVESDATSWLEWAGSSAGNIHPAITAYISDNPKDLFGEVSPDDRYADPSPRGWAGASEILFKGEKLGWSADLLNKKVCGRVGKSAGIKYSNYYEHYQQLLPMVNQVFKGEDVKKEFSKLEPTKQLVAGMIVGARFANQLDEGKTDSMKHVISFLQSIPEEIALLCMRCQIQNTRFVQHGWLDDAEWGPLFKTMRGILNG